MANKRHAKFPTTGFKDMKSGPRHDNVGPEKTKNWAGLPGGTQPKDRSYGVPKIKGGAKQEGI